MATSKPNAVVTRALGDTAGYRAIPEVFCVAILLEACRMPMTVAQQSNERAVAPMVARTDKPLSAWRDDGLSRSNARPSSRWFSRSASQRMRELLEAGGDNLGR